MPPQPGIVKPGQCGAVVEGRRQGDNEAVCLPQMESRMAIIMEKVTVLITRRRGGGHDLLLFEHPHTAAQIPAGTVDPGEAPRAAALREAAEETSLVDFAGPPRLLGVHEARMPDDRRFIAMDATVYARPDASSFDWIRVPAGVYVAVGRRQDGFTQVRYEEPDDRRDPQYVSFQFTGWVSDDVLTDVRRRHFYHLVFEGETAERWSVYTDNHRFTLFWSPLDALPPLAGGQAAWVAYLDVGQS